MYKNVLQSIDNIAVWPLVSFMIFFAFFIVLLWWVFSVDKEFIDKMKSLPMDEAPDSESNDNTNGKQE
jgi:cytochrome c oxidase cbb3-type subunit 4